MALDVALLCCLILCVRPEKAVANVQRCQAVRLTTTAGNSETGALDGRRQLKASQMPSVL